MRFQMRRRGIVPLAFATLLTVAAGLSLAEEHAWMPITTPVGAAVSARLSSGREAPNEGTSAAKPETAGMHSQMQAGNKRSVGSRALTGHDVRESAADTRGPN
jgi:hypothetical protein